MSSPVIVITGASGGVGRGIALCCGRAGWTVWIAARREAEGTAVAQEVDREGGQGRFVVCDASDRASIEASVAEVVARDGRLDGFVHNATSGLSPQPVRLADVSVAALRDHAGVSVRGSFLAAQAAYPHLVESHGSLLLLTSEAGFEGKVRLAPYAAVKAAQRGMVRALAREWGPAGVRVNAIAPLAGSPAMDKALAADPELGPRVFGRNPLGRVGDAVEDIGTTVRFLLSQEARYVTGHTIPVDGGSCAVS